MIIHIIYLMYLQLAYYVHSHFLLHEKINKSFLKYTQNEVIVDLIHNVR